jgi:hypothetical protein
MCLAPTVYRASSLYDREFEHDRDLGVLTEWMQQSRRCGWRVLGTAAEGGAVSLATVQPTCPTVFGTSMADDRRGMLTCAVQVAKVMG